MRIVLAILAVVTSMSLFAHEKPTEIDDSVKIKKIITAWMNKNNIPGVAVEMYKNGVPSSYYFGYADPEKKIPVTQKTIFEIGSITKLFTSLLVAQEMNSGKMSLKDSVAPYVPELEISSDELNNVTLLNLATHTSGLPTNVGSETKVRSQLPEYLANWTPSSPIGTQWTYSNLGIGLLGYALESETHENINELYRHRILQPLGMTSIGVLVPKQLEKNYARGYDVDGKKTVHNSILLFPASAALKASAHDMSLFLSASLQLPETPEKIANAMRVSQTAYFKMKDELQGMGWVIHPLTFTNKAEILNPTMYPSMGPLAAEQLPMVEQKFDGNALIDKTGGTAGFRSYIAIVPNRKSGIVILANHFVPNSEIIKIGREILFDKESEYDVARNRDIH